MKKALLATALFAGILPRLLQTHSKNIQSAKR